MRTISVRSGIHAQRCCSQKAGADVRPLVLLYQASCICFVPVTGSSKIHRPVLLGQRVCKKKKRKKKQNYGSFCLRKTRGRDVT